MKNIFILCIIALISCSTPTAAPEAEKNITVVKGMFDAFNRHDWKAMAEHYADPASFLDPSLGSSYVNQSRKEIEEKYAGLHRMFADIHDEVIAMYPSGDKVIVEFVSTGTGPDSVAFSLPIATVLTIENGLITKDATYYDADNH
jgi:ketosteroid isomerase-like protein